MPISNKMRFRDLSDEFVKKLVVGETVSVSLKGKIVRVEKIRDYEKEPVIAEERDVDFVPESELPEIWASDLEIEESSVEIEGETNIFEKMVNRVEGEPVEE